MLLIGLLAADSVLLLSHDLVMKCLKSKNLTYHTRDVHVIHGDCSAELLEPVRSM